VARRGTEDGGEVFELVENRHACFGLQINIKQVANISSKSEKTAIFAGIEVYILTSITSIQINLIKASMLDKIKSVFTKAALKITWFDTNSRLVNWACGEELKGVGKVLDLKIDFKAKTLKCNLKLNGEIEAIGVSADGFELISTGDRYYINIESAQVTREWLQTLVNQFVVGKQIEIPAEVHKTLTGMFGK